MCLFVCLFVVECMPHTYRRERRYGSQMGLRMEMSGGRPVLRRAEENSS